MPKTSRGLHLVSALWQFLSQPLRQVGYLLRSGRRSQELADEMAFHRDMATRAGRPASSFGNPAILREQAREAWGWTWIDRLFQDLRYATRMLARSPGFTITAILILAIGIGVNVGAFTLFNLIALQPIPVRDPSSLISMQRRWEGNIAGGMPYPTATFYRDHSKTLSAVLLMMSTRLELDEDIQPVRANFVSANFFRDLGANAAYGRLFDPARDEAPDAPLVAVIGHDFWQSHFAADSSIVGKTIKINHKLVTVVGVEPYAFPSLEGNNADIWLPVTQQPYFVEGSKALTDVSGGAVGVWARLAPGVTAKMAEAELLALTNERRKQYPKDVENGEYIHTEFAGHLHVMQQPMYEAAAVVGILTLLILVVACANLGGLLLARGVAREHELSIRLAIGASRKRIFRQLFTESLLLAILGSSAGLGFAYVTMRIILATNDAPKWMSAAPDWRILLFAVAIAFLASLVFGFAPAWQLARQKHRRTIARQILIGVQVAASCVLLIVASLLVRAVEHTLHNSPGFGYEQVISISPGLGEHGYKPADAQAYLNQLEQRLHTLPNVASISMVKLPPLGNGVTRMDTELNGRPLQIFPNWIDTEFFRTMQIPILLGRNFLPAEKHVVIVSQSMAKRMWPGENPVGKLFEKKDTVVGVAGDARVNSLNENDTVELYWPAQLEDMPDMSIIFKTNGAPDGLTPTCKVIVQSLDPVLFPSISLLKANFRKEMKPIELAATAISLIGTVAMFLAGIGILGLVAYTISQRTKEIAIRIALGAPSRQVLVSVLRQFSWPVAIGLVAGIGGTIALSQILRHVLYGISNLDPLSYATAIALLVAILVLAALLPARRALKLDVARALHQD